VERMQQISGWESTSESSELFKTCAAAKDAKFELEQKHQRVKSEEMEDSDAGSCEEEGADSYTKEDIDFIEEVLAVAPNGDVCVCACAEVVMILLWWSACSPCVVFPGGRRGARSHARTALYLEDSSPMRRMK
jgi:hypothetical protein